MLTILKDVEDEVHQSSRLRYRYPWFDNLAFGQVRPAIVATDDLGMHLLADEFKIPIFHCHEVLKKMLTVKMVDKQKKTHRNGWVKKPCNWPKGNINPSGCQAVKVGCGSQALKKTWQGSLQIC